MSDNRAQEILKVLKQTYQMPEWTRHKTDPFKTLIMTIISQNTNDRNAQKAFEKLSNNYRINPETLATAQTRRIEASLKVAGLYRNKAAVIKQISETIVEKYHGNLKHVLSRPLEEARSELLQLRGIGPKTADVVLLFAADKATLPIDTHVDRVSKRLFLASADAKYETVRKTLQSLYSPQNYLAVHILFILHGREYCRARSPLCDTCPLRNLCPSRNLFRKAC
jgi:endonuclease-3